MGFDNVIHRCYNSAPGALVVKVAGCDRSAFSGTRDLLVSSTRGTFKHQFLLGGPVVVHDQILFRIFVIHHKYIVII